MEMGSIPGSTHLELLCTTTGSVLFQRYVFKEIQNILHLNGRLIQNISGNKMPTRCNR